MDFKPLVLIPALNLVALLNILKLTPRDCLPIGFRARVLWGKQLSSYYSLNFLCPIVFLNATKYNPSKGL